MKMKVAPYAFRVFSSMGRKGDIIGGAYLGLIVVGYVVKFLSLSPDADRAHFWGAVCSVVVALYVAATVSIVAVFICDHMNVDGVYPSMS